MKEHQRMQLNDFSYVLKEFSGEEVIAELSINDINIGTLTSCYSYSTRISLNKMVLYNSGYCALIGIEHNIHSLNSEPVFFIENSSDMISGIEESIKTERKTIENHVNRIVQLELCINKIQEVND